MCFRFRPFPFRSAFFRPLLFRFRLLSLCFFLSVYFRFRLTVASPVLRFRSRFHGSPRSSRPGFPCLRSRFSYSAFCSFPFILPGFAPTAVPPVLPFCSASSRPLLFRAFPSRPLPFVRICSVLTTQPSVLSFPLFPISPDGGSLGALRFLASPLLSSSVRPVSMPSFRFRYSASCDFLSPLAVSCHRHYTAASLLFPARLSPWLSL